MYRRKWEIVFAIVVVYLGLAMSLYLLRRLWTLDANGLSDLSGRPVYWDFTNLWIGARLAWAGHISTLFDVESYRAAVRSLLSPATPDQEWSYPPSMLLVGLPLAALPILPAYLLWSAATLGLAFAAARLLGLSRLVSVLVALSPATCVNILFGQNGALTAFLLIVAFLLVSSRPVFAGLLLGLLTVKPHIGLLAPFCLLAGRHWLAILVAALTAAFLVLVTGLCFGFDVWLQFVAVTRPLMVGILEAPFPQSYQMNAMTFFVVARAAGLGLVEAYAVQGLCLAMAISASIWLWSGAGRVSLPDKACLTMLLGLLATPYGYVYDALPLSLAAAHFFQHRTGGLPVITFAWLYPEFNYVFAQAFMPVGVFAPLLLLIWALSQICRERVSVGAPSLERSP